jgi:hypothetical protein
VVVAAHTLEATSYVARFLIPAPRGRLCSFHRCHVRTIHLAVSALAITKASWTHHIRAHNQMADALANLAMDRRTSSQVRHPSARPGHCGISAHLDTDLRPWLAD